MPILVLSIFRFISNAFSRFCAFNVIYTKFIFLSFYFIFTFQLNLFLSKLTGTQIGFTTLGLLTITKEFLLTVLLLYLSLRSVRWGGSVGR